MIRTKPGEAVTRNTLAGRPDAYMPGSFRQLISCIATLLLHDPVVDGIELPFENNFKEPCGVF
jgi:hypothetical protein